MKFPVENNLDIYFESSYDSISELNRPYATYGLK